MTQMERFRVGAVAAARAPAAAPAASARAAELRGPPSPAEALRAALARGFTHVLINIGALDAPEYETLLAGLPRRPDGRLVPRVTMCTFQETYGPETYARFMGTNPENPRSDFARRLTNFDRACDAGMWVANPGVLLGLNSDVGYELLAPLAHVRHLRRRGMEVYVSLPRLRKASGTPYP